MQVEYLTIQNEWIGVRAVNLQVVVAVACKRVART